MAEILGAAQEENIGKAAFLYAMEGISVIPLKGKKSVIGWEEYQHHAASPNRVARWESKGLLQNVGIVCGRVSRLAVIDLDGLDAVAAFEKQFPDLLDTFTVATGSGRGKHLYFSPAVMPKTTRCMSLDIGNLELRADGCYVVAPPSVHPDSGQPYTVARAVPVMRPANLEDVAAWIMGHIRAKVKVESPPPPGPVNRQPMERSMSYAYGQTALTGECRAVLAAAEGERNNRLYRAAYNLGQLVADGVINQGQVEATLLAAAATAGLLADEAGRTIRSGLKNGTANPRSQQWQKRR